MFAQLFMVFGIACALHSGQACFFCEPNEYEYTLSDVYCYPYKHVFLIQAEVVAETGPFLNIYGLDRMTEEEKEQKMAEYGFMRYTMAVKRVYRDDWANIQQTIVIEAYTNTTNCGTRLALGKTYVLSGTFDYIRHAVTLETSACEYIREYDTEVEVVLPECTDQPVHKRSIEREGPAYINTNRASSLRPVCITGRYQIRYYDPWVRSCHVGYVQDTSTDFLQYSITCSTFRDKLKGDNRGTGNVKSVCLLSTARVSILGSTFFFVVLFVASSH